MDHAHVAGGNVSAIANEGDADSNYGSDFTPDEEEILNALFLRISADTPPSEAAVPSVEDHGAAEHNEGQRVLIRGQITDSSVVLEAQQHELKSGTACASISDHNITWNFQSDGTHTSARATSLKSAVSSDMGDGRSPLQKFRTYPRKALSVTDLVSPAWCELQYWYSLTKYGRVRRTPVMKRGSTVHQTLEDETHTTVQVDVVTNEDFWGLRIWNIISGLRCLRETGQTRELQVWGVVDGLLVNGVIDELSFTCPDYELEAEGLSNKRNKVHPSKTTSPNQLPITDFLTPSAFRTGTLSSRESESQSRKVYLSDVKTRTVKTLPKGPAFRPTLFQLMLYHRFFRDLASGNFDPDLIFNRYEVDASARFSDSFVSQIAGLDGYSYNSDGVDANRDLLSVLLKNNSVRQFWGVMMEEFKRTIPEGADGVGDVLKAEYRSQLDGQVFGVKTFLYDNDLLQSYLADVMMWWRGEREARGVIIEEAYKCRTCEFADGCKWRNEKTKEATQNHRLRSESYNDRPSE